MYDTTYYGLNCWSKSLFEKLGWMVLAKKEKDKNNIKCYIESIEYLLHLCTFKTPIFYNIY
jgi:hypothetical protein